MAASVEVDQAQVNRLLLDLVAIGERHGIRFPRECRLAGCRKGPAGKRLQETAGKKLLAAHSLQECLQAQLAFMAQCV